MVTMSAQKNHMNNKQIKAVIVKEFNFLKNIFSVVSLPQIKDDDSDDEVVHNKSDNPEDEGDPKETELPKRARSIAELEEKLAKLKSEKKFNLKNKLMKKSLNSKLSKKLKKKEKKNNKKMKVASDKPLNKQTDEKEQKPHIPERKPIVNAAPVFNTDAKLVFSKFDFSSVGQPEKPVKREKDPKKILENLKLQDQKLKDLEEKDDGAKAKEIKEKMAWKTILQKAEGQKIKDDPLLLKKSIKKMEQKKKQSKNKWDTRVQNVAQKKEDKQKQRKENISKKKKEKKSKVIKAAQKRGRVVL